MLSLQCIEIVFWIFPAIIIYGFMDFVVFARFLYLNSAIYRMVHMHSFVHLFSFPFSVKSCIVHPILDRAMLFRRTPEGISQLATVQLSILLEHFSCNTHTHTPFMCHIVFHFCRLFWLWARKPAPDSTIWREHHNQLVVG